MRTQTMETLEHELSDALEEIDAWKTATGLVGSGGERPAAARGGGVMRERLFELAWGAGGGWPYGIARFVGYAARFYGVRLGRRFVGVVITVRDEAADE